MSSVYFNINGIKDQLDKLAVINDFYTGNSLPHFKKQFVDQNLPTDIMIRWNKRYRSSNYMDYIVREYLDYIQILDENSLNINLKTEKDKELVDLIKAFFKKNKWRNIYKNMAKYRKLYGDVYIYWFFDDDNMMRLKTLDSKNMSIKTDKNDDIFAYVYETTHTYQEKDDAGNYTNETIDVRFEIDKTGVVVYHDDIEHERYANRLETSEIIPLIHLQFLKNEENNYSEIPTEPLVDICLDLDRLETNIATINHASGTPKILVTDGGINAANSYVGSTTVVYVDTLPDKLAKGKQAKVQQLEITNGLDSSYREREDKIDILFRKANLVPPSVLLNIASSDSGQVVATIRKDLEAEIDDFYDEIIDRFTPILNLFLTVNGKGAPEDSQEEFIKFIKPETAIASTMQEKLSVAAQQKSLGIKTVKDLLLSERKMNEEQIEEHNKQLILEASMMSSAEDPNVDITPNEDTQIMPEEGMGVTNQGKL